MKPINGDNLGSIFVERDFNQRFGARCFCGKSWSDNSICGDPDPEDKFPRSWRERYGRGGKEARVARLKKEAEDSVS